MEHREFGQLDQSLSLRFWTLSNIVQLTRKRGLAEIHEPAVYQVLMDCLQALMGDMRAIVGYI